MDVNKNEKKNVLNYLSVADELYLEKMSKAEKQINEILEHIVDINDALNDIQQKIEDSPNSIASLQKNDTKQKVEDLSGSVASLYKDYPQNKQDDSKKVEDSSEDTRIEDGKRRARRYKEKETKKVHKKKFAWIGEMFFYIVIIVMVIGAFLIRSNQSGRPTAIAGYSFFTVLTGSMQDEIPQGSLVVAQEVDPKTLQIGDDITFMANQNTIVTHRIISIVESYQDTGKRAFETKGIMNEKPDKNLVPAVNVIGKVTYHSKFLGDVATYLGQNWMFLIFVLIVICVFVSFLKSTYRNNAKVETESKHSDKGNVLQRVGQINRRKKKKT